MSSEPGWRWVSSEALDALRERRALMARLLFALFASRTVAAWLPLSSLMPLGFGSRRPGSEPFVFGL